MSVTYCWRLQVRTYETDRQGNVQDSFYLNYLQEAATRASTAAGYSMDWYIERRRLWLIRTLTIRYSDPARLGDELEIATWVSDFKRVQSHREYDMRRVSDSAQILRARANWAYIDTDTMLPTRVPDEFDADFGTHTEPKEVLEPHLELQSVEEAHHFVNERIAQQYHIDQQQHVNNGVYPRWIEGVMHQIMKAVGWAEFTLQPAYRKLEYLHAAQEDDPIQIVSQLVGWNNQYLAWTHAVYHAQNRTELVKDAVVYRAATPIPPALVNALATGRP